MAGSGPCLGGAARERFAPDREYVVVGAAAVRDLKSCRAGVHTGHPPAQNLFFAGRYTEAEELCRKNLLGRGSQFGTALPMAFLEIERLCKQRSPDIGAPSILMKPLPGSSSLPAT